MLAHIKWKTIQIQIQIQDKLSSSLLLQRWQQKSDLGTSSIGRCKYNPIAIGQQSLVFTNINASRDKTNQGKNYWNNPFKSKNDPNSSQKPLKTHCKLATLSRRQRPMLPGRRYRSMSPVGRQSLQFYNECIEWWPSANNFQCWTLEINN